jgi:hypothetical protein
MPQSCPPAAYRYPNELLILNLKLIFVFLVIVLPASATFCASVIFILFAVSVAYFSSHSQHQMLMERAFQAHLQPCSLWRSYGRTGPANIQPIRPGF